MNRAHGAAQAVEFSNLRPFRPCKKSPNTFHKGYLKNSPNVTS